MCTRLVTIINLYIIIPLLLGLVFNKYAKDLKEKVGKQLEKTEIIE